MRQSLKRLFGAVCLVVGCLQLQAYGADTYVSASRSDDSGDGLSWATAKKTIQAAVDICEDGSTVWVDNGTYSLSSTLDITNDISVCSISGPDVTILDGNRSVRCVYMTAGTLSGVTLINGYVSTIGGGGVYMGGGGTLNNCVLTGNQTSYLTSKGGGAYMDGGGMLNNCVLTGNLSAYGGGSYGGTLINCALIENQASLRCGGGGSCYGTLINCTLTGNYAGHGGGCWYSTLINCIVWGNTTRFSAETLDATLAYTCSADAEHGCDGCITNDPLFISSTDLRLQDNSPCIDAGDNSAVTTTVDLAGNVRVQNGVVEMGVYEGYVIVPAYTSYVDAEHGSDDNTGRGWATAKQTIQAGIDRIEAGGRVLVTNGAYGLSVSLEVCKDVAVRSVNGPEVTIVDGGGSVRCVEMTAGILSGFTLTNGFSSDDGGGAYMYKGGSLDNCILVGNSADNYGGGSSYGTLSNCMLIGNSAEEGGGSDSSTLINCTLSGNTAGSLGGGGTYSAMTNCIVWGNTAPSYADSDVDSCTLSYTCSSDAAHGSDGCITNNPQFVSATDLRLLPGSPCLDAGTNSLGVGSTDLDGRDRIIHGTVDMGAYEYAGFVMDTDGDSYTDWEEYIVGTAFADPEDYFRIGMNGSFVEFNSRSDRRYTLYWCTNLFEGVWTPVETRMGAGGADAMSASGNLPAGFYKVEVELP